MSWLTDVLGGGPISKEKFIENAQQVYTPLPDMADSPDLTDLLNARSSIDTQQLADLNDILSSNQLPSFDANTAANLQKQKEADVASWLAPYTATPMDVYRNSDTNRVAMRLNNIANNLNNATGEYQAGMIDFNRALSRHGLENNMALDTWRARNAVNSDIQARGSASRVADIQRAADVKRINQEYQNRIKELKAQAEAARRKGDMAAWSAALTAIGALAGTFVGAPVAGAAVGAAAGNAIGGSY